MAKRNPLVSAIKLPAFLWRYANESKDELKKVSWPSRATTTQYTIIVVVSSVAIGFITGGVDFLLARVLERVL